MVKNVELKIDLKLADSLDLTARAEYFDNLAEQIAKASENADNCVKVMAGSQECFVLPEYEEMFKTCYNEFDVSRVLAKKIEGKTLEEKMEYFNTLAKKIARFPKTEAVKVPYGNKTCMIDKKYAGLFTAAYREFTKAKKELKALSTPTVTIDYDKAKGLDSEKRADYFASLLLEIGKVPLRDDAELVSIGRLSQKVNKNDIEVFKTCYMEFENAKKEFENEAVEKMTAAKVAAVREAEITKKSNKEKMDFYLDILLNIVSSEDKKFVVRKNIGSKVYTVDVRDEAAFNIAEKGYYEARRLYKIELREMAIQHEYQVDKEYMNKLTDEERQEYLEKLAEKIIKREIFGETVEVHRGKNTYKINKIDVKTFKYCESSISGIKHMLQVRAKASNRLTLSDIEWGKHNNLTNNVDIEDLESEGKEQPSKEEKPKKKRLWRKKDKKQSSAETSKVEIIKQSALSKLNKIKELSKLGLSKVSGLSKLGLSKVKELKELRESKKSTTNKVDIIEKLYLRRINALTSKKITHLVKIYMGGQWYLVDYKYKEKLYNILKSYYKYLNNNKKISDLSPKQKAVGGLVAAGAIIFALCGVNLTKSFVASTADDKGFATESEMHMERETGTFSSYGIAAMATGDNVNYDTLIKDMADGYIEGYSFDESITIEGENLEISENENIDESQNLDNSQIEGEGQQPEGEGEGNQLEGEGEQLEGEGQQPEGEGQQPEGEGEQPEGEGEGQEEEEKENEDDLENEKDKDKDKDIKDKDNEIEEEEEEEIQEEILDEDPENLKEIEEAEPIESDKESLMPNYDETIQLELEYTETYEAIYEKVSQITELPEETILNADLNADRGNEEICYGYHLTTGNTVYDMPLWEALEVMYVGNAEDANTYQSCLAVFSCIANRMEDGRFTYANNFHDIISAGNGGQFSVWNQTKASNYQLDQVPDYVLQAYYDCFYGGIRNVDTIEFRSSGNKADGRFQVVPGDNNHFKLVQHVDRADQKEVENVLVFTIEEK